MLHGELPQIIIRKTIMTISVVILAIIIGKLTEKTKSLLIAITLHYWLNLQFEFAHSNTHIAGAISVMILIFMIRHWNNKKLLVSEPLVEAEIIKA
jgi:hypothetical protein